MYKSMVSAYLPEEFRLFFEKEGRGSGVKKMFRLSKIYRFNSVVLVQIFLLIFIKKKRPLRKLNIEDVELLNSFPVKDSNLSPVRSEKYFLSPKIIRTRMFFKIQCLIY